MIDLLFYFKEKSVSKASFSFILPLGPKGDLQINSLIKSINKKEANLPAPLIYPYTSKLSHSRYA